MSRTIDVLNPQKPKRIALVASNAAVSKQTGWPIGFWWSELSHPYWEFVERGYLVEIFSPEGGTLQADNWSDPRDESQYSADDLISLGFINSPSHMPLVEKSKPVDQRSTQANRVRRHTGSLADRDPCTPSMTTTACRTWRPAFIRPGK